MGAGYGVIGAGAWPSAAQLGAVVRRFLSPSAWIESLRRNLAAEEDRWLPWAVVAFAGGDAFYFGMAAEPAAWMAIAGAFVAAVFFAVSLSSTGTGLRFAAILLAAAGFGFSAAKLRTDMVTAPVISREMGPLRIEGRVESVSDLINGQRVIFAPSKMGRSNNQPLPHRFRLTLRNTKAPPNLEPGQWVSVVAVLRPPPEPNFPGGYDFARGAFFDGIGGVAFAFGAPKTISAAHAETFMENLDARIERLRHNMTKRVRAVLPGSNGAIAAALITGDRGAIEEDDNKAFRDSGLAHILSISGLHMALAGLGIFWAIRALLALIPLLALQYPIKKWAAVAAIGASFFYLLISGGGSAPTRSFIMLAMMLAGILFDRPALSMHPVALAGLAILAVMPESILDAGFQMSFAAIIGLIALAEWQMARKPSDDIARPAFWSAAGVWLRLKRYFMGIVLATTVATLATAPFAIFHFNRTGGYSILSNVLADFSVAFVVMPSAAIAVILMPFGLDQWPLQVMGWGVQRMVDVAHWVGGLPGAVVLVPSWPLAALLLIVSGGLWIGIWRRRWRWFGLVPLAAGLALTTTGAPADVLIARDAKTAAVRQADGTLAILGNHPDDYTAKQWLLRQGDARDWEIARKAGLCDDDGCVARSANGSVVAFAQRADALADDCARADVLVSATPVRVDCPHPQIIVDRLALARKGASAIRLGENGVKMETVAEARGTRPWVAQYRRTRPTKRP
jgi:competence protein ComEC